MDLHSIVCELHEEKSRIDEVIRNLESLVALEGGGGRPYRINRRGRKEMPEAERKMVSERMRKYWAAKRKK